MVYSYFTNMKNIRGVPLTYVIHKTPDPAGIVIDMVQDIIQNSPLQGNMCSCETKKVLKIIKELTEDNNAEIWMKGKHCSREAMLAFQNHYYG